MIIIPAGILMTTHCINNTLNINPRRIFRWLELWKYGLSLFKISCFDYFKFIWSKVESWYHRFILNRKMKACILLFVFLVNFGNISARYEFLRFGRNGENSGDFSNVEKLNLLNLLKESVPLMRRSARSGQAENLFQVKAFERFCGACKCCIDEDLK